LNDSPPLVPAKGAKRTAALRVLGLGPNAKDEQAHEVIHHWIENDDPRFERYYDRFVGPFEPTIRERVFVDPARLEWTLRELLLRVDEPRRALIEAALAQGFGAQIDLLMNHPAFEGAAEIEDIADRRVRYRWTFTQLAERIAARFPRKVPAKQVPALAAVLARVWHVDWSDDPIEIVAGIMGKAPEYAAVRHELRNLRRLSPEKGPGRPRESFSDDEIAALRVEAEQLGTALRETFALRERLHERNRAEMIAIEQDTVRRTIAEFTKTGHERVGLVRAVESLYATASSRLHPRSNAPKIYFAARCRARARHSISSRQRKASAQRRCSVHEPHSGSRGESFHVMPKAE
jgi:hypothetical protein